MGFRILQGRMVVSCATSYAAMATWALVLILGALSGASAAQRQSGAAAPPRPSGKASAVIDMTGQWVSIVDEDWVWRMATPAKGDFASVPLNKEGERVTLLWDPAKDKAAGNECKAYWAGNIMRIPGRFRISWVDDNTLQIESDAGMQKRLFHFDGSKWKQGQLLPQGDTVAMWEKQIQTRSGSGPFGGPAPGKGGKLHAVTRHMSPGYLHKNGIPYSEESVMTEHYTVVTVHGVKYLILTSVFEDPKYLTEPYILSSQFKLETDESKWEPSPCRPTWPLSIREKLGPRARRESQ